MADIFISYKREDQENKGRILPIVRALQAEGFDVFYDVEIPPGSTWEQVLQTKINMAKCVLVMWSEVNMCTKRMPRPLSHVAHSRMAKGASLRYLGRNHIRF